MPAVVVLAHALRHFSQQALREIGDQSDTPLSSDDVRWVVTVPAIWTAAAKQLMRQAAYDVMLPDRPRPKNYFSVLWTDLSRFPIFG